MFYCISQKQDKHIPPHKIGARKSYNSVIHVSLLLMTDLYILENCEYPEILIRIHTVYHAACETMMFDGILLSY